MSDDTRDEDRKAIKKWLRDDKSSWALSTATVVNMEIAWLEATRRERQAAGERERGLREALQESRSLYNLGYNVRNAEDCVGGKDGTGTTSEEYRGSMRRVMRLIAAALAAVAGK